MSVDLEEFVSGGSMSKHKVSPESLVAVPSLREFFRDTLQAAMSRQKLAVEDQTEQYVVNLLTVFARADAFYEKTPEGPKMRPLAAMFSDAMAAGPAERNRLLQRIGDVSLFFAGFFAQSFARKLVDIDYHIAMGGTAYGSLAGNLGPSTRASVLCAIFAELAAKFQRFVDALNEVSEMAHVHTDRDVLRLYEIWMKTGSQRAHGILHRLGVDPSLAARNRYSH
jgi:hypothetical protein